MYYLKQKNYDEFTCIADKCPENCCSFWQIMVDDESLSKYEKMAEADDRIRNALDIQGKCFRQTDGGCNFLDPDGLCHLQRTYGETALCDTCRSYPRHVEEFENVREYTLTLSCPEAARMLLNDTSPMELVISEDDEDEEFEDFDYILYDKLTEAREKIKNFVQDRSIDILTRMKAMLVFAKELQEKLDDDDIFGMDDVQLMSGETSDSDPLKTEVFDSAFEFERLKHISSVLFRLEPLHDDWMDIAGGIWDKVFSDSAELEKVKALMERHAVPAEQILMFFVYTYFCGAVYDDWIYSKIAIAVYSTIWIFCMLYAGGGDCAAGSDQITGTFSHNETDSLIKAAWSYARETEHSDVNLDLLEGWFMDNM